MNEHYGSRNPKKKESSDALEAVAGVGAFVAGVLAVGVALFAFMFSATFIGPLIYYFFGWVASISFVGDWFVSGASKLGVNVLKSDLPVIFAFLGIVGGFFRSSLNQNNKKNGH